MNEKNALERQAEPTRDEQIRRRREQLLDEALEETFPASDPPSVARPHIEDLKK